MQKKVISASTSAFGGRCGLLGYTFACTSTAVIKLRDGGASGTIVFTINVASNTTVTEALNGIPFNTDLYVEVVSGSGVTGTVWFE